MIIKYFLRCRRAATAIEYALIVGLIAVALIVGVRALGGGNDTLWNKTSQKITGTLQ